MILVSAGHHAMAQGATADGRTEWPEATRWQMNILQILAHRAGPVPTGLLRDKVAFINSVRPAIAVEIHFNSAIKDGVHVGRGCETLYTPGDHRSKEAAELVQAQLAPLFPPSRGTKEGWYRMDRPGIVDYHGDVDGDEHPDYFLDKTECPAIIIEPEFIHRWDAIYTGMGRGCLAISNALIKYLNWVKA